jgi:sensor histidine kinase regulating citrate/malate metabolism
LNAALNSAIIFHVIPEAAKFRSHHPAGLVQGEDNCMAVAALRNLSVPLWVRLGIPISLIIALAIGLISFLNYYNYEKTYRQLNVSRITVVARDLRQAIEAGLNVGLAPRNNTQLDSALSIARDHTEGLRFAVVIDEYANRTIEVGQAAAEQDWLKRIQSVGNDLSWTGEGRDSYQVGLPFRNSFGVMVGAVILGYDKTAIDRANAAMRWTLLIDWLSAVTVLTILALLGVRMITRRLESELGQAEAMLDQAQPGATIPELRIPLLGEEIERGIPAFIRQTQAVQAQLAGAAKAAR